MKPSTALLFFSAFFMFCMFDTVTTIVCYEHLGSFDSESSGALKAAFEYGGLFGFLFVKCVVSIICLLLAVYVIEAYPALSNTATGVMLGSAGAGLFAGLSNLNGVFNGSTFSLYGADANILSILIILSSLIIGVSVDVLRAIRLRGTSAYQ